MVRCLRTLQLESVFDMIKFADQSVTQPRQDTDAWFRAWAQFIEDTLVTTGGWVVTADTGQTPPGSLIAPTTTSQKRGYRIYRMNDALQPSSPVFIRMDFGSYLNSGFPAIWPTIGTGSDGSGNITNKRWDGGALGSPSWGINNSNPGLACNSFGSANTNRFSFCLWSNASSAAYEFFVTLERSKDALGNDTGDGLLLVYKTPGITPLGQSQYIILAGGTQPAIENGITYILTRQSPSESYTGDIGVGVIIHFKGVAQQPGTNVLITNSSDVSAEGSLATTLYGQLRTYQQIRGLYCNKALTASPGVGTADPSARVLMRYD